MINVSCSRAQPSPVSACLDANPHRSPPSDIKARLSSLDTVRVLEALSPAPNLRFSFQLRLAF